VTTLVGLTGLAVAAVTAMSIVPAVHVGTMVSVVVAILTEKDPEKRPAGRDGVPVTGNAVADRAHFVSCGDQDLLVVTLPDAHRIGSTCVSATRFINRWNPMRHVVCVLNQDAFGMCSVGRRYPNTLSAAVTGTEIEAYVDATGGLCVGWNSEPERKSERQTKEC